MREIVQSLIAQATRSDQDALLLRQFVETKDQRAFRELYDRHAPSVLALISRMLKPHQPDDVFQEVFKEFALQAGGIKDQNNLRGWLFSTARNKVNQELRKKYLLARFQSVDTVTLELESSVEARDSNWEPTSAQLHKCLGQLTEEGQEIIRWMLEGKTVREMASESRIHFTTLQKRKTKALGQLRDLLKKEYGLGLGTLLLWGGIREACLEASAHRFLSSAIAKQAIFQPMKITVMLAITVGMTGMMFERTQPASDWENQVPAAAVVPAESLQERNLRLFHSMVWPRLVAVGAKISPDSPARLIHVKAPGVHLDTMLELRFIASKENPTGRKRIRFIYDTFSTEFRGWIDDQNDDYFRPIDLKNPIRTDFLGRKINIPWPPIDEIIAAFRSIPKDSRMPTEARREEDRLARAVHRWRGRWIRYRDGMEAGVRDLTWDYRNGLNLQEDIKALESFDRKDFEFDARGELSAIRRPKWRLSIDGAGEAIDVQTPGGPEKWIRVETVQSRGLEPVEIDPRILGIWYGDDHPERVRAILRRGKKEVSVISVGQMWARGIQTSDGTLHVFGSTDWKYKYTAKLDPAGNLRFEWGQGEHADWKRETPREGSLTGIWLSDGDPEKECALLELPDGRIYFVDHLDQRAAARKSGDRIVFETGLELGHSNGVRIDANQCLQWCDIGLLK